MAPLVSVIIPVYNAEKFFDKCMQSVLCQTYPNLEIIVVDDGSTDNSGSLCDMYAQKDKRVVVHHQKNQGVSAARNWALDYMHGEYVIFVDSDDFIAPDLVECCLKLSIDKQCDIVVFKIQRLVHAMQTVNLKIQNEIKIEKYETSENIRKKVLINKISNYLVMGFYKRKLWKNVKLPAYSSHEDMYILPRIFINAQNIISIDNILYYYNRMNLDSLSAEKAIFDARKRYYKYKAYEEHKFWGQYLKDEDVYKWAVFHMMWDAIKIYYVNFYSIEKLNSVELKEILQFMKENWTSDMKCKIGKKMSILRWSAIYFPYLCKLYGFIRYKQELLKRWAEN